MTTTMDTWPRASGYFAAGANFEGERQRLELLEEHDDPVTFGRLGATGVSPGWHCLEVAAGGGSVARWLALSYGSCCEGQGGGSTGPEVHGRDVHPRRGAAADPSLSVSV